MIRISGPNAVEVFRLTKTGREPKFDRRAEIRRLIDKSNGDQIDDTLLIWFPAPGSYTGENVVELQVHGGRAIVSRVLSALSKLPEFRPAEPGEFTRRAVENGRMDLTRAEAVADLIYADTEGQRKLALRQYDGSLANLYGTWRDRLIRAAAWLEANIDFPDEEVPDNAWETGRNHMRELLHEISRHLHDEHRGEITREGFQVAVIGPPNAGKSSLVNSLARRDVAIVSPVPGTTRDIIEVKLDLGGYAVVLADTAGLRVSSEPVEMEGVRRARERAAAADFRLLVLDGSKAADDFPEIEAAHLVVLNKSDLVTRRQEARLYVSAKTGEGLDDLIRQLSGEAAKQDTSGSGPLLTRARHRYALEEVAARIELALEEQSPELAAEHLRVALRGIGRITGSVDLDELLDVVFRDFCIGK